MASWKFYLLEYERLSVSDAIALRPMTETKCHTLAELLNNAQTTMDALIGYQVGTKPKHNFGALKRKENQCISQNHQGSISMVHETTSQGSQGMLDPLRG